MIFTNYPNSNWAMPTYDKSPQLSDVFIANRIILIWKIKIEFQELLNYPILMLDRKSTTNEYLHALFQQHQLDLVPEIELSSNDLLLDLQPLVWALLSCRLLPAQPFQRSVPVDTAEELPSRS